MEETTRTGTLQVWVTSSRAELPVEGATVAVTTAGDEDRRLLALLVTDESGRAGPVTLPAAPGGGEGLTPGGPLPFADYALWVEHEDYAVARVEQFQIFPGIESVQQISLLPLPQPPWLTQAEGGVIDARPQDL